MTREEFNNTVLREYSDYRDYTINNSSKEELFNNGYANEKATAIFTYLVYLADDEVVEPLFDRADGLLGELCLYEQNYNVPMWTKSEDIEQLIADFLSEEL